MKPCDKRPGKVKLNPRTHLPEMTSWGLGTGIPPLTTDPENPIKPFADYVMEDDDRCPYDRR